MSADAGGARLATGWMVLVLLSDGPALERSMVGEDLATGLVSPGVDSSLSLELSEGALGEWFGISGSCGGDGGSFGRAAYSSCFYVVLGGW